MDDSQTIGERFGLLAAETIRIIASATLAVAGYLIVVVGFGILIDTALLHDGVRLTKG